MSHDSITKLPKEIKHLILSEHEPHKDTQEKLDQPTMEEAT